MAIKDLAGVEKPLTKLIEVVAQAVGVVYTDTVGVNAEVRRREKLAEVEQKIELMGIDTKIEAANRIRQRLLAQEIRRQENIDETVREAATFLPESVSEEKPDPDWTTAFFNHVQDISSEEMRTLWAKILAGEVAQPGSYSRRTLEILKNLSPREARTFQQLESFVFGNYTIFKFGSTTNTLDPFGVHFAEWKVLHEAQLVVPAEDLRITISGGDSPWFTVGKRKLRFRAGGAPSIVIMIKQLTDSGLELSRLIQGVVANEAYLKAIQDHYGKQGIIVEVADL